MQFVDQKLIGCFFYNAPACLGGKISSAIEWNVATIFDSKNHNPLFPINSCHAQNKTSSQRLLVYLGVHALGKLYEISLRAANQNSERGMELNYLFARVSNLKWMPV